MATGINAFRGRRPPAIDSMDATDPMDVHRNPLVISLPLGSWAGVPMRLSVLTTFLAVAMIIGLSRPPAEPAGEPVATEQLATEQPSTEQPTTEQLAAERARLAEEVAAAGIPTVSQPAAVSLQPAAGAAATAPAATAGEGAEQPADRGDLLQGLKLAILLIGSMLAAVWAEGVVRQRQGSRVAVAVAWPAGGLVVGSPPRTYAGELAVTVAIPIVHASLCILLAPAIVLGGEPAAFHPFRLPDVADHGALVALGVHLFALNWKLLLIALLPLDPLPGGRLIQAWRADTRGRRRSTAIKWALLSLSVGLMILACLGPMLDNVWLTMLGGVLVAYNAVELMQSTQPEPEDDSPFGYDFSQGYTSLESSAPDDEDDEPVAAPASPWQRWKEQRNRRRRDRELAEREAAEDELDRLLQKISEVGGVDKLTPDEQRTLRRLSTRFKS